MSGERHPTRHGYRRRLLAAAVASLALHLLLGRGLTLARLRLTDPAPAAATRPAERKPRRDFPLQVSRDTRARPDHERPLRIEVPPAARPRADVAAAGGRTLANRTPPPEPSATVAAEPQPVERSAAARDVGLDAAAAPARAEPRPAGAPVATAEPAAAAPAAADPAAASPLPAAATRRSGQRNAAVRWRPREVALLERLAAPPPALIARPLLQTGDEPPAPSSPRARAATAVGPSATPTVEPIVAAASTAVRATVPDAPRPAAAARRERGDAAVVDRSPRRGPSDEGALGQALARATAPAAGGVAIPRPVEDADRGPAASAPVRRAAAPPSADPVAARIAPATATAASSASSATDAGPAPRPSPGLDGPRRSALGGRRGQQAAASADEAEELSVAAVAPRPLPFAPARVDDDAPPAPEAPAAPERVAVVALAAEGRVRDVAEAFVRRTVDRRESDRDPVASPAARISTRADAAVARGLEFLARCQEPDGRWSLDRFPGATAADAPKLRSDTAATGLSLLAFLGAGYDHFDGPHRDTVRRGLEFLIAAQRSDGDLYIRSDALSDSCAWLYSHGIASMALCEAVGMTGDARVRPAAEKACRFIADSQQPGRGGWRYTPRSDSDLSVSGWMLVALRSGELAGVRTDPRTIAGVRGLIDAAAAAAQPGRYAYNPAKPDQRPSQLSSACMTAVGALMRLHTGSRPTDPRVRESARILAAIPPTYGTGSAKTRDSYLWYYASQVLVHTGGREWEDWYAALVATLAATQETAAPGGGSWDPLGPRPDRWGPFGGRIYVTALHLLALEVPRRHLPTVAVPAGAGE